jgi:C1A family cysteine protease
MNYSFGCEPDSHDERDYRLKSVLDPVFKDSVDLTHDPQTRWWIGEAHDQGTLGSCTAFATNDMVRFVRYKTKLSTWPTSELFTYYATRKLRGTTGEDSGATAREALKATADFGVTKAEVWPYDIAKFKDEPPKSAWEDAEKHQSLSYFRVEQTENDIIGCLSDGYPFIFGMKIYDSFFNYKKSIIFDVVMPFPKPTKEKYHGGHCMLAVGYYKQNGKYIIIIRNSWGIEFCSSGYIHAPLDLLLDSNFCFDLWTLRTSEDERPKPEPPKPYVPFEPVNPVTPEEPLVPFYKTKNFYFLLGFGVLAALFLLLK